MSSSDYSEYQESTTVTLDWTVRGLKQLFESSKGESKSKVTKSVKFGGGRWQILFYPNSGLGTDGGGYLSIYLSCEPTQEERDAAVNGRWVREGRFKFSFELRNLNKTVHFITKEANDHSFTWKTANWGWAQFARRDVVYYNPNSVRSQDAFIITCTINSSPSAPVPPPDVPRQIVPCDLLDAVGGLLDDPIYSDVEFVLPRTRTVREDGIMKRKHRRDHKIYAARKILMRAEYFSAMFSSGFAESSEENYSLSVATPRIELQELDSRSSTGTGGIDDIPDSIDPDDSDMEDEQMSLDNDGEVIHEEMLGDVRSGAEESETRDGITLRNGVETDDIVSDSMNQSEPMNEPSTANEPQGHRVPSPLPAEPSTEANDTRMKLDRLKSKVQLKDSSSRVPGPRKARVVVQDVAYATYRAVLYYIYTNTILFAPLSSSFLTLNSHRPSHTQNRHSTISVAGSSLTARNLQGEGPATPSSQIPPSFSQSSTTRATTAGEGGVSSTPVTRHAWIQEWSKQNPGRVPPCSAKSVYRLADKLNLVELKSRSFDHIVKSLTVENVPYEMFTSFSATFEDVRRVQIAFFLENWSDIRTSDGMRSIWQQIRVGRHPGFEEVWPLIAMNLEFRPQPNLAVTGDREIAEREA